MLTASAWNTAEDGNDWDPTTNAATPEFWRSGAIAVTQFLSDNELTVDYGLDLESFNALFKPFDGTNLDAFKSGNGPAKWTVKDGIATVNGGDIQTRQDFGDVQMHIEWMIPADRDTNGQGGGNSGVFFNNQYEVQILDSFENPTYADGSAGSFYGQHPPLVNPCNPKGQWNVYDIIYTAPRWDADGNLTAAGRATVIFNGDVVQNNTEFWGSTAHMRKATYGNPHGPGPIRIQDHGDPLRFKNIWVRPLGN